MLESADRAALLYQYDSQQFKLSFHSEPAADDQLWTVGLLGPDGRWFSPEANGETTVERRLNTISDAFVEMSIAIDPDFGYLMLFDDHGRFEAVPRSHIPSEHGLEALPFLLLLSEPWIEYCGGRSHVLETPAYEIQTLDMGSIALRIKEHISVDGCHYLTGFDHLFGQYDVLNAAEPGDLLHFWDTKPNGELATYNIHLRVEKIIEPFAEGGGHMRCENMDDIMMDVREIPEVERDRVAIEHDGEVEHTAGHVYNESND